MYLTREEIPLARLTYSLFHTRLPSISSVIPSSLAMSSRFADPTAMRTRSPIYHDDNPKRPPPSPSNKAPPPKKFDAKSRAVSEELCLPSKAQPLATPSSESFAESCPDKVRCPVLQILAPPPPSVHPT